MIGWLAQTWPWYVVGPAIGLVVPALLIIGNKPFGVSSSLRHLCAACLPGRVTFFRYDWKRDGLWNLVFVAGMLAGGLLAGLLVPDPVIALSARTQADLGALGIHDFSGLVPRELIQWSALLTPRGILVMLGGGFLVGFGTAYAGGCTSGHAIAGLASFQRPSLVATVAFFVAGVLATRWLLPILLR